MQREEKRQYNKNIKKSKARQGQTRKDKTRTTKKIQNIEKIT